jgi:predicted small lipoprotein YifL
METMKVRAIDVWKMRRAILLHVFLLAALVTLTACGGGGGAPPAAPASSYSQPASVTSPASDSAAASDSADLDLAARLYKGDERTPAGFAVEQRPANVLGTLSTRHLKNTDLATGPQAISPVYEICTNDMAQAIDWSEKQATWQGQYSDMVEVNSDNRMFEVVRVPRADVSAMIRHRVFRCDYLDRAGSDLRADTGSAGSMNQRPLTADELKSLAEYLWQFTMFNNSDYAVLGSSSSQSAGSIVETIRMGQLVRGSAGGCDTVQVSDWTHTMNATDGTLTRGLTAVRSFKVRSSGGSAASCSG